MLVALASLVLDGLLPFLYIVAAALVKTKLGHLMPLLNGT
jgi:hypothetical protein